MLHWRRRSVPPRHVSATATNITARTTVMWAPPGSCTVAPHGLKARRPCDVGATVSAPRHERGRSVREAQGCLRSFHTARLCVVYCATRDVVGGQASCVSCSQCSRSEQSITEVREICKCRGVDRRRNALRAVSAARPACSESLALPSRNEVRRPSNAVFG
ncbi:hypothetical protein CC85DRAFT_191224 [Cutaneotrichosporon oleaginosum]|uniref:Uncharacterized protein n=1 Tax=Cutaneotrichosporon oleaginosum TaxID=879819 RepID=A0A0J0XV46_9TREE|nr:uncharacterized protein CC85DRAFT_191224 [Cutaneotrichosporon oleaginosum]KLT44925.1 hypothetical protein CC85DRAFT_191224 [Cutaneotrichosporon oleaginosum]TXT12053.1 hypothetical protein COLE_02463 [Cutaneotrichosporon oleaginosum]